jgi:hypothetical protein
MARVLAVLVALVVLLAGASAAHAGPRVLARSAHGFSGTAVAAAGGHALAAWTGRGVWVAGGRPGSRATRLSHLRSATPAVAVDADGDALAAWRSFDGSVPTDGEEAGCCEVVFAARRGRDGRWTRPAPLSVAGRSLAYDVAPLVADRSGFVASSVCVKT